MDKVIKRFENIGHIKMFKTKNNDWQNYWFTSAQMLSPLLILPVPKIYNINLKDWATQNDLNHRCLKTGSTPPLSTSPPSIIKTLGTLHFKKKIILLWHISNLLNTFIAQNLPKTNILKYTPNKCGLRGGNSNLYTPLVKLTKLGHGQPMLHLQLFHNTPPPVKFFWIHACPWRLVIWRHHTRFMARTGLIHFGGTGKRGAPETHLINNAFYLWENIGLTWAVLDHCYCKLPSYFFGGWNEFKTLFLWFS